MSQARGPTGSYTEEPYFHPCIRIFCIYYEMKYIWIGVLGLLTEIGSSENKSPTFHLCFFNKYI